MAGPHAAGVAVLHIGKNGGKMDSAHVLAKLRDTSDDLGKACRDPYYGYSRVHAFRAVTESVTPTFITKAGLLNDSPAFAFIILCNLFISNYHKYPIIKDVYLPVKIVVSTASYILSNHL